MTDHVSTEIRKSDTINSKKSSFMNELLKTGNFLLTTFSWMENIKSSVIVLVINKL